MIHERSNAAEKRDLPGKYMVMAEWNIFYAVLNANIAMGHGVKWGLVFGVLDE